MTRVSIFLAVVALLAGMVGCTSTPAQYTLVITSSQGGNVTTPGEGTFTYNAGTKVNLVAEADDGYQFVNWSCVPFPNIADVRAAATTIVMDSSCYISASFAVPTLVRNWYDLNAIRDGLGGVYILMNDLNSNTPGYEELAGPTANAGRGWQPITSTNVSSPWAFVGTFDGQGYEICDLVIDYPDESGIGLFAAVGDGGGITNLGVVNAAATGYISVAALAAVNYGTVTNCYSVSSVTGTAQIGGLVGWNTGTAASCYSVSSVNGAQSVGGLVGGNQGTVSDCSVTGSVSGSGNYVGGLVGYSRGTVSDCSATGSVSGSGYYVGGLVGYNNGGTVSGSFWDTQASGQSTSSGGTGKTTAEMRDTTTFSGAGWNIIAVEPGERNPTYIWNIVDGKTYPFLSWQAV